MKAALKHIFGDKINTSMNGEYAMVFEQSKSPKNKLNLMDKQKKYCVICNSKMHWTKIVYIKQIQNYLILQKLFVIIIIMMK